MILIGSYNNAKWCKKNLKSVFRQTYPHWRIHYVDDCSTDGTGAIVDAYIKKKGFADKCTVQHNLINKKAIANYYFATQGFDPHEVVVNLDGDDWFAHKRVLERLASVYKDPNVWMTYGSYKTWPKKTTAVTEPFPPEVIRDRSYRSYKWVLSHVRTYYAALFQKIPMEDLFYQGEFMKVGWDVAFMIPMAEMASNGHFRFIKKVLYVYNCSNPISDFRIASREQHDVEAFVRTKPPYKPLEKLF